MCTNNQNAHSSHFLRTEEAGPKLHNMAIYTLLSTGGKCRDCAKVIKDSLLIRGAYRDWDLYLWTHRYYRPQQCRPSITVLLVTSSTQRTNKIFSKYSITQQVLQYSQPKSSKYNYFYLLAPTEDDPNMDKDQSTADQHHTSLQATPETKFWVQDTNLSTIAELINQQLKQDRQTQAEEPIDSDKNPGEEQNLQQHLKLNLVRHCRATGSFKLSISLKDFFPH